MLLQPCYHVTWGNWGLLLPSSSSIRKRAQLFIFYYMPFLLIECFFFFFPPHLFPRAHYHMRILACCRLQLNVSTVSSHVLKMRTFLSREGGAQQQLPSLNNILFGKPQLVTQGDLQRRGSPYNEWAGRWEKKCPKTTEMLNLSIRALSGWWISDLFCFLTTQWNNVRIVKIYAAVNWFVPNVYKKRWLFSSTRPLYFYNLCRPSTTDICSIHAWLYSRNKSYVAVMW